MQPCDDAAGETLARTTRRVAASQLEPNPALVRQAEQRARSIENRVADRITAFAGSMPFVYIHIAWFGCWIGFGVEKYPYGLLTMIVSLEAIFLSTFVMISQNRADAKRQAIADQQWQTVKEEDRQNEELLELSRQILDAHEGDSRRHALATGLPLSRDDRSATARARGRVRGHALGAGASPDAAAFARREPVSRRATRARAAGSTDAAVAAVWHRRRAGFVAQTSTPNRR